MLLSFYIEFLLSFYIEYGQSMISPIAYTDFRRLISNIGRIIRLHHTNAQRIYCPRDTYFLSKRYLSNNVPAMVGKLSRHGGNMVSPWRDCTFPIGGWHASPIALGNATALRLPRQQSLFRFKQSVKGIIPNLRGLPSTYGLSCRCRCLRADGGLARRPRIWFPWTAAQANS